MKEPRKQFEKETGNYSVEDQGCGYDGCETESFTDDYVEWLETKLTPTDDKGLEERAKKEILKFRENCKTAPLHWITVKDAVLACLSFANQQHLKSEWISVDERLPEVRQEVLIISRENAIDFGYVNEDGSVTTTIESITHWMPLPNPPKQK